MAHSSKNPSSNIFDEPKLPADARKEMAAFWESASPEERRILLLGRQSTKLSQLYESAHRQNPELSPKGPTNALAFLSIFFEDGFAEDPTWFTVYDIGIDQEAENPNPKVLAETREQIETQLFEAEETGREITPEYVAYLVHIWLGHTKTGSREKSVHWSEEPFSLSIAHDKQAKFNSREWSHQIIQRAFQQNFYSKLRDSHSARESSGCLVLLGFSGFSVLYTLLGFAGLV